MRDLFIFASGAVTAGLLITAGIWLASVRPDKTAAAAERDEEDERRERTLSEQWERLERYDGRRQAE